MCLAAVLALFHVSACSRLSPPDESNIDVRIGFGLTAGPQRDHALLVLESYLYSEALVSQGWNGRPTARIAEDWTWSEDGLTLEVRIREGLQFHDGSPVTSHGVAATLAAYQAGIGPGYVGGFRHVRSITAPDERTVVIHLDKPDSFLVGELTEITVQAPHDPRVSTGPFRLVPGGEAIRAERYDDYYLGRPAITSISIIPFDSQRSAWAALMRGEIDVVQEIQRDAVEFMEGSTQIRTYSSLRPFYIPLVFNLRHPILRNVEVRRALNEAVDRAEIVRDALRGFAQVADDPIWPAHWAHSGAARRYSHNPEAARLRLERAGFPIRPLRSEQMASRFQLTCLFWSEDPQFERIALLLQRQLAGVGVDLQLTGMSLQTLVAHAGSGRFDAVLLPMSSGRSMNTNYAFWRSPETAAATRLNTGYTGADAVLDHLRTVRSDAEVRTAVADLQQRFYEDAPAVFIAWQETTRAVDARIDVSDGSEPDVFFNIRRWRPAAPQKAGR
ncbi:glutathione ABC transporter substrate-binding protein [soil metagenome]